MNNFEELGKTTNTIERNQEAKLREFKEKELPQLRERAREIAQKLGRDVIKKAYGFPESYSDEQIDGMINKEITNWALTSLAFAEKMKDVEITDEMCDRENFNSELHEGIFDGVDEEERYEKYLGLLNPDSIQKLTEKIFPELIKSHTYGYSNKEGKIEEGNNNIFCNMRIFELKFGKNGTMFFNGEYYDTDGDTYDESRGENCYIEIEKVD